jgi:hypothetical protein
MISIKLIKPITLVAGTVVGFNEREHSRRKRRVEQQAGGEYLLLETQDFKAGTILGLEKSGLKAIAGFYEELEELLAPLTIAELKEYAASVDDVAELEGLLVGEERKGAIEAINKRIEELKAA